MNLMIFFIQSQQRGDLKYAIDFILYFNEKVN